MTSDTADLHREALRRLCFACAKIMKANDRRHEVEKHLEMLSKAFGIKSGIFTMDGVTPSYFCLGCKLNLTKLSLGETVNTGRRLVNWEECGVGCTTCAYMETRKKGGAYKKVSELFYLAVKKSIHIFD